MKQLWILAFILISLHLNSIANNAIDSTSRVNIVGVVFDANTLKVLTDVKIHYTDNFIGYTDSLGTFNIKAEQGDSLCFSYLGYTTGVLVINDSLKKQAMVVGVYLTSDTLELSEVLVLHKTNNNDKPSIIDAKNNINLIISQVSNPRAWDAEMNTQTSISEFSYSIMNKGLVDTKLGVSSSRINNALDKNKKQKQKIGEINYKDYLLLRKLFFMKNEK